MVGEAEGAEVGLVEIVSEGVGVGAGVELQLVSTKLRAIAVLTPIADLLILTTQQIYPVYLGVSKDGSL
jgi:hypothetical protein